MGRKSSIVVLIILVSGITALVWFMQRSSRSIAADPYDFVPPDAYFFLESNNLPGMLNSFTSDNGLFGELSKIDELEKLAKEIVFLRDFINNNEISLIFENNRSVISFHPSGDGRIQPLLSMSIPPSSGFKSVLKAVSSAAGNRIVALKGGGLKIYSITGNVPEKSDTLFIAGKSGLILSSNSSSLLKKTLGSGGSASNIRDQPGLSRIMSAAGRYEDKLFILFRNFSGLIKGITDEKAPGLSGTFARLAGSAEGDIYINENSITLSGYTETADSTDLLYRYKVQQAGEMNSSEVLPAEVVLFETMLLSSETPDISDNAFIDDSTRSLALKLRPFIGDEISRAFVDLKDGKSGSFVMLELRNRTMAEQIFSEKVNQWALKQGLQENEYKEIFQPDDQSKIPVYKTRFKNIASAYLPGFIEKSDDSLFAFIDNFMITGNSYEVISRVLYDNILNKTLANDIDYQNFESTMPSRAGYYFYCVPSGIIDYLSGWLSSEIVNVLKSNEQHLRKIPAAGYRFAASNGMIYNTISVKYGEEIREDSGAEWETLLDAVACIKPFFFTNHNTGAKEIFVQDNNNNAYLVNSAGRVLWKIKLSERIYGQVFMIDYYGNGKYQILFAGRNWLHLLDRNGNYVERYPVRLRSPASGPPALFDYDGTREYRILIPGEDKLIYAYDKTGSVVKGWKPFMTSGTVKSSIRFFRVSGKDYLVAADNTNLYLLDRTGSIRLKLKEAVVKAEGSEIRLDTGQKPSLVLTSPEGSVQIVTFDGNIVKFNPGKFTADHSFDFFDVDGDGFGEYLFIDSGKLYLYDNDMSPVFEKDFGTVELEGPISFIFSPTDRKIGVFDILKKQIYLIDKNGNIMNGFPLRGASVFSIGKLSDQSGFHLIVGGDDNFLYNYKLNTGSN